MSSANPLKRRYQVFVSSTYEDLKDERQHVIQALLETKCIPLGMELFPAASVDQWKLIKRIIDECDYYLVIVAGRYGSSGNKGISYTEMEFDYAHEIKKPVIGFYHKSVKSLQGFRLEQSDAGKQKLEKFTKKIKSHTCKEWSSPEGLGSAVKSAILYQLEFNPQPGWIKADTIKSSDIVTIGASKRQKEIKLLNAGTVFKSAFSANEKLSIILRSYGENKPLGPWILSWDEFILSLKEEFTRESNLNTLVETTSRNARISLKNVIGKSKDDLWYNHGFIDKSELEMLLKVLMAKKLVKMRPSYSGSDYSRWRFTPKGLQYLAELETYLHFSGREGIKKK